MEVEDEQQPGPLKAYDLINFVLERHVSLRSGKPAVFFFSVVHRRVKLVEVLVTKKYVVNNIPLPPGVVERVVVPRTREIEPLQRNSSEMLWSWRRTAATSG